MVGIGGIGMSALALHWFFKGEDITGSNIEANDRTDYLKNLGIDVRIGHSEEFLSDDVDEVVVTRAVGQDNPEVMKARKLGIPVSARDESLKEVLRELHPSFAVTGTDGKTTTTAMIYHALKKLGRNPYAFLGGIHPDLEHGNYSRGEEGVVFELDESVPTFSSYVIDHLIITNARGDHLESYGDKRRYVKSFVDLVSNVKGVVVTFADDEITSVLGNVTFGVGKGDFKFLERRVLGRFQSFTFEDPDGILHSAELMVPGFHNCLNALAVIALLSTIGYDVDDVAGSLKDFQSVYRRFTISFSSDIERIFVLDDYAHTPEEVENLIKTVREVFPKEKIVAIFQPHRYSRTLRENGKLARSVLGADDIYITEIYGAFEKKLGISSKMIVDELLEMGRSAEFVEDLDEFTDSLEISDNTVYLFIGAGDIIYYSGKFVDRLKNSQIVKS